MDEWIKKIYRYIHIVDYYLAFIIKGKSIICNNMGEPWKHYDI